MSQSLSKILLHVVFSTKGRCPFIITDIRAQLYRYVGGTVAAMDSFLIAIGGVEDHVHLLVGLSRTLAVSKLVEEVKKSSSKWIKTQGRFYDNFAWQRGYGAFSVSQSHLEMVRQYIENQKEHHKKMTFQDEYRRLLFRYNIAFDERYVWD